MHNLDGKCPNCCLLYDVNRVKEFIRTKANQIGKPRSHSPDETLTDSNFRQRPPNVPPKAKQKQPSAAQKDKEKKKKEGARQIDGAANQAEEEEDKHQEMPNSENHSY